MKIKNLKSIYFVGIKGVAMTALAIVAKEMKIKIDGSDVEEEFVTDAVLKRNKINWRVGFKKENITSLKKKPDLVIVTGAHGGMTNPEAVAAKKIGCQVLMHGKALGMFIKNHQQISVAGCHGKTTTAAMIATIFSKSGLDPSFAVGCGDISALSNPGHAGKGKHFVVEADEYITCPLTDKTPRFMWQDPKIAVFTNIEYDHPDVFSNLEVIKQAFLKFGQKIAKTDLLVAGIDNKNLRQILPQIPCQILTFGRTPLADFQIERISFGKERTWFWVKHKDIDLGEFSLQVPGVHNVLNAIAAAIVGFHLGISWQKIKEGLKSFSGTKRRFEKIGEINEICLFDDYAHHPTEVVATLKAARDWFPKKRIICIFQPHTFSRTKALFDQFAKCFAEADIVIISDIYSSSREKRDPEINAEMLVQEAKKYHKNIHYLGKKEQIINWLGNQVHAGDIIFTMGAGNIFSWHKEIMEMLNG